jgi:hypothetical protein
VEPGFVGSGFFVWPDIASGKRMTSAAKMRFFMAEIIATAVNWQQMIENTGKILVFRACVAGLQYR